MTEISPEIGKLWIYARGRVDGPFTPDELIRLDGFSADSTLCAEQDLGTVREKWTRAANVPAFSGIFPEYLRGERLADALEAGTIGSVEGRNIIIDRSLSRARKMMDRRLESFDTLKAHIAERIAAVETLGRKVRKLSLNVSEPSSAAGAVQEVKAAMAMQRRRISELQKKLEARRSQKLQSRISELETRLKSEELSAEAAVSKQQQRIRELEEEMEARGRKDADERIAELEEKLKTVEQDLRRRLSREAAPAVKRRRGRRAGKSPRQPGSKPDSDPFGPSESGGVVPGL